MNRVLIANLASPANPGDHAILQGSLKLIRETLKPAAVTLVTRAYSQKEAYLESGCEVVPSFPDVDKLNLEDSLRKILRIPAALGNPWPLAEAVKKADCIFLAGGAYFYSYRKAFPGLTYLAHVSPVFLAKKSCPVIFLPQSYGPFGSKISKKLFRYSLGRAKKVFYREDVSADVLRGNFAALKNKFAFMPDHALYLEKSDLLDAPVLPVSSSPKIIGVTIRPWHEGGLDAGIYMEILAQALEVFAQEHKAIIRIIVQVQDDKRLEGDETISLLLKTRLLKSLPPEQVELYTRKPFFTLGEISSLYAQCHVMVSMRLHSALLGYILGCPALVAGYQHKASGILEKLGLNDLYLGAYHDITKEDVLNGLNQVWSRRASYQQRIEAALNETRGLIRKGFEECLK